jgi:hypothetical protein
MRIARKVQRETIEACVQRLQGFHFTDGQPAIHPKALEALRAMVTGGTE